MKTLSVRLALMVVFIVIVYPYNSLADEDSIWFAGMNIKIGMAKSLVLSEIRKNNRINAPKESQPDMWTVTHESGGRMNISGVSNLQMTRLWELLKAGEHLRTSK